MKQHVVEVRKDAKSEPVQVHKQFGSTVAELVSQFGEEIVYNHALSSFTVALQGFCRSKMNGEKPLAGKELQAAVTEWKPGTRKPGKPAAEKLKETFEKLTPEQKKALLKELTGKAA